MKLHHKILRLLVLAMYRTGFYRLKVAIQRFILREQKAEIRTGKSLETLVLDTMDHPYTADKWWTLGDYPLRPEEIEYRVQNEKRQTKVKPNFDCDEFALLHTARITKALNQGVKLWFRDATIKSARLAAIYWNLPNGQMHAHHVCLLDTEHGFVCLDYLPSLARKPNVRIEEAILTAIAAYGKDPQVWCVVVMDVNLQVQQIF